jgi:hypothetical protein
MSKIKFIDDPSKSSTAKNGKKGTSFEKELVFYFIRSNENIIAY